jgi:hypothetical protein
MTLDEAKVWIDRFMSGGGSWNDAQSLVELVAAEQKKAVESVVVPFDVESRCYECGEPMLAPVSLWRCSAHPERHHGVGPGVAFEIRSRFFFPEIGGSPTPLRGKEI